MWLATCHAHTGVSHDVYPFRTNANVASSSMAGVETVAALVLPGKPVDSYRCGNNLEKISVMLDWYTTAMKGTCPCTAREKLSVLCAVQSMSN